MTRGMLVVIGAMLSATCAAAHAAALTVSDLERLIRSAPVRQATFEETRESPWLPGPAISRGTMRLTMEGLEKHVDSPRRETWRLLDDRIEWVGVGSASRKQILFAQAPALAPVVDVMRRMVAGDLEALQKEFSIRVFGEAGAWRAVLSPLTAHVSRTLEHVEIQGTGSRLQIIIIAERNGDKTTTRLVR